MPGSWSDTYAGTGESALLWVGSYRRAFPTSYIPTAGAAATRAAEVASMPTAGIVTAGTAGTLVGDAQITSAAVTAIGYVTQLDDGTTNNRCTMRARCLTDWCRGLAISGGASQFNSAVGSGLTPTTPFKSGIAWTAGQQITAANGCIRRIRQWRT